MGPEAERWQVVREIVESALELSTDRRIAYVAEATVGDAELAAEVNSLLAGAEATATWIDRSPVGKVQPFTQELAPGRRLAQYEITDKLGAGGMGVVYLAKDERLDRLAALKVLTSLGETEEERRRFAREARAASALNHPNIITIYEYGCADEIDFIAMEYIRGVTLAQLLQQNPPPLAELLEIARQTAKALASAHAAGIVHRDLKPANIMIADGGLVKVLDFGIAKVARQSGDSSTEHNLLMGTPTYMAPEVAQGETADARADIFALGVILYEMAAKRRPFQGKDAMATLSKIVSEEPPRVDTINPAATRQLADLIAKCLAKKPEARFPSMTERAEKLEDILAPAATKSRRWLLAGASALAAGGLTLGISRWTAGPALRYELEAQKEPGQLPYRAAVTDTFRAGWKFRLRLYAAQPGFFYVLTETAKDVAVIYPLSGEAAQPAGATVTGWYVFDQSPGMERVWVVWSEKPRELLAKPGRADQTRDAGIRNLLKRLPAGMAGELLQLRHV